MKTKKPKPPTNEELSNLHGAVDNEGFFYYLTAWGPDWDLIGRMGFNVKKLKSAVATLKELQDKIMSLEEMEEAEG